MKVNSTIFKQRIAKLKKLPDDAVKDALPFLKKATPKRSGNARRKTKISGDKIRSNYSYAGALDAGQSPQAPDGFTAPTIEHIEQFVNKTIGKI